MLLTRVQRSLGLPRGSRSLSWAPVARWMHLRTLSAQADASSTRPARVDGVEVGFRKTGQQSCILSRCAPTIGDPDRPLVAAGDCFPISGNDGLVVSL